MHCAVVELNPLVDESPAASLLILPVLDDLVHWDISLKSGHTYSNVANFNFQYLP